MKYNELTQRIKEEINAFPMFFAFSDEQFKKGLEEFGAKPADLVKGFAGALYRKTDADRLHAMLKRHDEELSDAMKDDVFLIEAICYELGNHEYSYTYDPTDTIECLGLDMEDERVQRCFKAAKTTYLKNNAA